ncbi:MAG: c-type cytochrome [Bryobacteraceae bacterium]
MRRNKYLLLGSSLGVLLLLILAAVQENAWKPWRILQASARSGEDAIPVQLRQITNANLRIGDRCVSCHVSMAPGEQAVKGNAILAAHKPVVHDPAEYGCTVCHGGQGAATDKADAHGTVHFWPEPMIPIRFAQAGCGTCHSALGIPNRDTFEKAVQTFDRLDCRACHRVDNRGGTIRPDGGGMEGPDLSRVGITGYDRDWYEKHLTNTEKEQAGPWKTAFGKIDEPGREQVATFLSTRVAAPALIDAKATFLSFGCLGCHRVSGVGGDEGPDLSRAGEKDPGQVDFTNVAGSGHPELAGWIAEHFRSPVAVVATSQMPPVAASQREIDALTMYVLSLRRRELPGTYVPRDRMQATRFGQREFAADGATLFGAFCAGCHGLEGNGKHTTGGTTFPAIANPDFLKLVNDEFLAGTIAKGRPGRRMPGWAKDGGLRPEEITRIVAHLRKLGGVPAAGKDEWKTTANPETGRALFAANCSGCHGAKGDGGMGPALHNQVLLELASDTYLLETISRGRRGTAMGGFAEASPARRGLARTEMESIVAFIRTWQGGRK